MPNTNDLAALGRRVITIAAAGVAAAGVALSGCSAGTGHAAEEQAVEHTSTAADVAALDSRAPITAASATLWVNGLGCPLCATNVDAQLLRLRGVESAKVDLGQGKVFLGLSGDQRPSPYRLREAVADAGFTLVKLEAR